MSGPLFGWASDESESADRPVDSGGNDFPRLFDPRTDPAPADAAAARKPAPEGGPDRVDDEITRDVRVLRKAAVALNGRIDDLRHVVEELAKQSSEAPGGDEIERLRSETAELRRMVAAHDSSSDAVAGSAEVETLRAELSAVREELGDLGRAVAERSGGGTDAVAGSAEVETLRAELSAVREELGDLRRVVAERSGGGARSDRADGLWLDAAELREQVIEAKRLADDVGMLRDEMVRLREGNLESRLSGHIVDQLRHDNARLHQWIRRLAREVDRLAVLDSPDPVEALRGPDAPTNPSGTEPFDFESG